MGPVSPGPAQPGSFPKGSVRDPRMTGDRFPRADAGRSRTRSRSRARRRAPRTRITRYYPCPCPCPTARQTPRATGRGKGRFLGRARGTGTIRPGTFDSGDQWNPPAYKLDLQEHPCAGPAAGRRVLPERQTAPRAATSPGRSLRGPGGFLVQLAGPRVTDWIIEHEAVQDPPFGGPSPHHGPLEGDRTPPGPQR